MEPEIYGGLPTIAQIKLLADWAPLLPLLQAVAAAPTNQAKAVAGVEVLRWLATKTKSAADDTALDHLEAMLKTPEGGKIVDFLVSLAGAIK